ncbi:pyridoxamine 5'-phosphate oxidase family protein [Paenibacillus sp. UMB4589-SE434]|uniref:pyridoxamine 5'-phosphate oxidase family protein n=1 Tax=Paenibacillus sp. UMB4589-SE434 TaxID=3046314 RepID=UPI00254E27AF|nr:pyridoxamine 5'-phosphate oxidase family protein [Paenibacillus sp. UMB4589-SE434]MDK8179544.1 pyridoxamine 5'-phosphate oxidase family protein [Paenibacillus sp. UMB4589-SE434]
MRPIIHAQRNCEDQEKINDFLIKTRTGLLGLTDERQPYVIPLNFVWWNSCIYFHGLSSGRKVSIIEQNNTACFTVFEEFGTVTDPVPAKTDTAYMSVMLFGSVEKVNQLDDSTDVLQQFLNKYVPGFYDRPLSKVHVDKYRSSLDNQTVSVYRLQPHTITAKENPVHEQNLFYPGKSVSNSSS